MKIYIDVRHLSGELYNTLLGGVNNSQDDSLAKEISLRLSDLLRMIYGGNLDYSLIRSYLREVNLMIYGHPCSEIHIADQSDRILTSIISYIGETLLCVGVRETPHLKFISLEHGTATFEQ
jgi:hypothetical protein